MVKAVLTTLAMRQAACHGVAMRNSKNPVAGGFIIAIAACVGAVWGGRDGQPSAGLLIGLGIGAGIALLIWLIDRRQTP